MNLLIPHYLPTGSRWYSLSEVESVAFLSELVFVDNFTLGLK